MIDSAMATVPMRRGAEAAPRARAQVHLGEYPVFFGALAAVVCYGAVLQIRKWGIDDSLDVFAVHGVGGIVGTLLLGLFISTSLGGTGYGEGMTPGGQLGAQALGIGVVALWSAVLTAILALAINIVLPMRVKKKDEIEGLDITSHGERGWQFGD